MHYYTRCSSLPLPMNIERPASHVGASLRQHLVHRSSTPRSRQGLMLLHAGTLFGRSTRSTALLSVSRHIRHIPFSVSPPLPVPQPSLLCLSCSLSRSPISFSPGCRVAVYCLLDPSECMPSPHLEPSSPTASPSSSVMRHFLPPLNVAGTSASLRS